MQEKYHCFELYCKIAAKKKNSTFCTPEYQFEYQRRPPDKSAYWKIIFSNFSTKTYIVGTRKNRLNGMVLLSTHNTCLN